MSQTHTKSEKVAAMVEWWTQAHAAIIERKLTKAEIDTIVSDTRLLFREKVAEFFKCCLTQDIPILVFSAGLGGTLAFVF